MRTLRITLVTIGLFQLVLGVLFLATPAGAARLLGLDPPAPAWANWLFAMMAARFLGYAYGMFTAAQAPAAWRGWIDTMIVIQAIDWIATIAYLITGGVSLSQVSTAAFMPVVFVVALLWTRPRYRTTTVDAVGS
jgi:hypothetical protein